MGIISVPGLTIVVLDKTPATTLRPNLAALMERYIIIIKILGGNAALPMFRLVHKILIQTVDSVLQMVDVLKDPNVALNSV